MKIKTKIGVDVETKAYVREKYGKFYVSIVYKNLAGVRRDKSLLMETIRLTKDTKLEIPVMMAGVYGLRRSEVIGLRWSAFDFENDVFYINHTVTTPSINGKKTIIAKDRAKNKASLRAMPLSPEIKERLLEIKERQQGYIKKFKRSYKKDWIGYLNVDELGELVLPDYVSESFNKFWKRNELREIRYHDLRHPYVKLKLKISSAYHGTKVLDFPLDFKPVIGIYAHLFNEYIRKCLC